MRVVCAALLGYYGVLLQLWGRGSVVGAAGLRRFPVMDERERECCGAVIGEAADMVFAGESGESVVPLACFKHRVGCPALGFEAHTDVGTNAALEEAIRQQVDLRSRRSCDAGEWEGRCPSGSTMLLSNHRRSCLAAGCIQVERTEAATMIQEPEGHPEQETIRAVVTQESRRLREASTGTPPTFYSHCRHLRKKFAKAEKYFFKQLKAATASAKPDNTQKVRLLLEEARIKGFRGAKIEEARIAIQKRDRPQLLRRVLGIALSEAARMKFNSKVIAEKRITSLAQKVQALSGTVNEVRHAAHVDMVGQMEAAAASDRTRVHLASCSARAHELDSKSAELEDFVAVSLARQHLMSANETSLPVPNGPDDEAPVEAVFARTSARFTQVKNMAVSFTADTEAIFDLSLAEIRSLRQQVRDLEETSTALKERAELAQQHEQKLAQENRRRWAAEVAAAELDAELASCEGKVSALEMVVLALLTFVFWQRRPNPSAAEEDQVPRPPDEEARADQPPAPLPPESARGSLAATAAAAAAAAVEYAPAIDAGGSEQEAEERAAQLAAAFDEARPIQERRATFAPELVFDAAAAPWALANDNVGTGPSAHTTSGKGVWSPPAAGTEHAVRWPPRLGEWVFGRWERGVIKSEFLHVVALRKGGDSAAVKFARETLKLEGGRLQRGARLGFGGFGTVDIVERRDAPGERFALKRISKIKDETTVSAAIEMLLFCRIALRPHENVLEALAMDDTIPTMPVVMPVAQGDLHRLMENRPARITDRLSLVADLARGTAHVHSLGFVHRDIKPENVLVFETPAGVQGKLADFGLARAVGEMCPGRMGTLGYMAHESMSETEIVGTAAHDVVGVAVVLLKACLDDDQLCANLFMREALYTPDEKVDFHAILNRDALGYDVHTEWVQFQFEVGSRIMREGTFNNWLAADKLHPAVQSPAELIERLPSFLAADPAERGNMDGLCALARRMHHDNS